jgi:hypothetical protein
MLTSSHVTARVYVINFLFFPDLAEDELRNIPKGHVTLSLNSDPKPGTVCAEQTDA